MINQRSTIKWDAFTAISYAEGFTEEEDVSKEDTVEAWAYIIANKLYTGLQGWFGRTCRDLIDLGAISEEGEIDWDVVDEL